MKISVNQKLKEYVRTNGVWVQISEVAEFREMCFRIGMSANAGAYCGGKVYIYK